MKSNQTPKECQHECCESEHNCPCCDCDAEGKVSADPKEEEHPSFCAINNGDVCDCDPLLYVSPPPVQKEDWEEEYFRRFADYFDDGDTVKEPLWMVRDFIRSLRQEAVEEERKRFMEIIEEMTRVCSNHTPGANCWEAHSISVAALRERVK